MIYNDKDKTLQWLDENEIHYDLYLHDPIYTVEESKNIHIHIPWSHTKNLFLRDKKWAYYLVTMIADKKLDGKNFKSLTGIKDFSFANADQLYEKISIRPGLVSIFWLINNPSIILYIDEDIWDSDYVWRHPNDNTATIVINHDMFIKYLKISWITYDIIRL